MTFRRNFLGSLLLILAIAAGYSGYWLYAAGALEDGFASWRLARAAEGYAVGHGDVRVRGYPTALLLHVAAPSVESKADKWRWSGDRVTVELQPWDWRRYRVEAFGRQTLDLFLAGRPHRLWAQAETAAFVGHARGGRWLAEGAVLVEKLRVQDGDAREVVRAAKLRGHARQATDDGSGPVDPALDVTVTARSITLAPALRGPLGAEIVKLDAIGQVLGKLPPGIDRAAVNAWRRDGGAVELTRVHLVWGALDLRANGTVTVDSEMRPLGAMTAEIRGYRQTVSALEQARLLRRNQAAASRLALDLLSKPDRDGAGRVVTVPVTAQTGALFLGPVRLLRLPPIAFPAPSG